MENNSFKFFKDINNIFFFENSLLNQRNLNNYDFNDRRF
jgi:hypothetical protein